MTIDEAIKWLQDIKRKHGGQTPVYFDCPKCKQAFTPGTVETVSLLKALSET